ncbi:hypothetical protein KW797_03640 [Candidatus Parcubacteria bacterium]|nr:hypothetical protein [Candidatus Parcubacteria bacterium]
MRETGSCLIFSPKQVLREWRKHFAKFYDGTPYLDITSRAHLESWSENPKGIALTNYEKMIPGVLDNLRLIGGIVADESSILKTGGGTIKWNLIKSCRGIPYKLSMTATPAPNDTMEFASQAAFLEKIRSEGEVFWTYFTKVGDSGEWIVKPHARDAFYRFMASWSIYIRNPESFGFKDNIEKLPEPEYFEHEIPPTPEQVRFATSVASTNGAGMFADERLGVVPRSKLAQAARGFLYVKKPNGEREAVPVRSEKPQAVAQLARSEAARGLSVLIWTSFDEEAAILYRLLAPYGNVAILQGSTPDAEQDQILEDFECRRLHILISKAEMLGYGQNLQYVGSMIDSGIDDSFERLYQKIRRALRTGQKRRLRFHRVYIRELEGLMIDNVAKKSQRFEEDILQMENCYRQAMTEAA